MVTAEQVSSCLRSLLPTVDLQTATERIIIGQLEGQMGESLAPFKALIRVRGGQKEGVRAMLVITWMHITKGAVNGTTVRRGL